MSVQIVKLRNGVEPPQEGGIVSAEVRAEHNLQSLQITLGGVEDHKHHIYLRKY